MRLDDHGYPDVGLFPVVSEGDDVKLLVASHGGHSQRRLEPHGGGRLVRDRLQRRLDRWTGQGHGHCLDADRFPAGAAGGHSRDGEDISGVQHGARLRCVHVDRRHGAS